MGDDIFESISQGIDGTYDEENRRIKEIANEFQKLCRLHEAQDTYVSPSSVFKVNNLLNSKSISNLLDKILLHNTLFPNTKYRLHGFAGYDGRSVLPVLEQARICNAQPATQIMIDTYMSALGFTKLEKIGNYSNNMYEVWDILPRNVLIDSEGDIYVIDAEIKKL